MGQPFIGEMRLMPYGFAPRGWARCDGQLLAISQNQALFSILGTAFGGDGNRTFGLPNLKGRVPVGSGSTYPVGAVGGEESHTLQASETPPHTHKVQGLRVTATTPIPENDVFTTSDAKLYVKTSANMVALQPQTIATVGGGAHPNLQPFQVITVCIALQGIFPSRN
jgi:microcystin-dependent protein